MWPGCNAGTGRLGCNARERRLLPCRLSLLARCNANLPSLCAMPQIELLNQRSETLTLLMNCSSYNPGHGSAHPNKYSFTQLIHLQSPNKHLHLHSCYDHFIHLGVGVNDLLFSKCNLHGIRWSDFEPLQCIFGCSSLHVCFKLNKGNVMTTRY